MDQTTRRGPRRRGTRGFAVNSPLPGDSPWECSAPPSLLRLNKFSETSVYCFCSFTTYSWCWYHNMYNVYYLYVKEGLVLTYRDNSTTSKSILDIGPVHSCPSPLHHPTIKNPHEPDELMKVDIIHLPVAFWSSLRSRHHRICDQKASLGHSIQ